MSVADSNNEDFTGTDAHAVNGKLPGADAHYDVVVVGAGPAGLAAALEAAANGASVLLVDEHPVSAAQMGNDVPYWFGGRMTGAVAAKARMIEQVFMAEPLFEQAFDAGIDVQLGVYAWGLWRNRANLGALRSELSAAATIVFLIWHSGVPGSRRRGAGGGEAAARVSDGSWRFLS